EFLRLSAELTADLDEAGRDALRERIQRILARDLPKRKGAYPWMVVLTRQGSLVESIFPEMILYRVRGATALGAGASPAGGVPPWDYATLPSVPVLLTNS